MRETALAADFMPCRACVARIERQLVPMADLLVRVNCPKRHLREWRKVSLDDPGERSSVHTRGVADQSRQYLEYCRVRLVAEPLLSCGVSTRVGLQLLLVTFVYNRHGS